MPRYNFCPKCGKDLIDAERGERMRRACPDDACGFVFWDNPTPVVAAIVQIGDDVILARNAEWPEGMFGLITGFLERGETPEDGVLREVEEELGLKGELMANLGVYQQFEFNQLLLGFHVKADGEITLGDEIAEIKRVPIAKLKPWPFATGEIVRDWLAVAHDDDES